MHLIIPSLLFVNGLITWFDDAQLSWVQPIFNKKEQNIE